MRQINHQSRYRPGMRIFQPMNGDSLPAGQYNLTGTFEDGLTYDLIGTFEDGLTYNLIGEVDA